MRVVVDANIVAAALVQPRGWTAKEFARADVEWFAPETLFQEIEDNAAKLSSFAGCSRNSFLVRLRSVRHVNFVSQANLESVLEDPLVVRAARIDPDDVTYLAAFVAVLPQFLWTRDRRLLAAFPDLAVLYLPAADDPR